MNSICQNENECICPKKDECPRHGKCCDCVKNHRESDSLPFCMFTDNDGDKSLESFYRKLKERFEPADGVCA
jgi:hypothetical protein